MDKRYAVVTFGWASTRIASFYTSKRRACTAASKAKGSGTCTEARVHACTSAAQAKTAGIGCMRDGEEIIYSA